MKYKNNEYMPLVYRIIIGLMFIIAGYSKLMNPSGITGMLNNLGFPVASLFAWIVILSELIFGILILLGIKLKYSVWPIVIILAVASLFVSIPNMGSSPTNLLFHLLTIAALVDLYFRGPGKYAIDW